MTIFVVTRIDYDDFELIGVFSNREAAEACGNDDDYRHVEEVQLQDIFEPTRVHTCAEPPKHGPMTRYQASCAAMWESYAKHFADDIERRAANFSGLYAWLPSSVGKMVIE